jgi:hypothetical protein
MSSAPATNAPSPPFQDPSVAAVPFVPDIPVFGMGYGVLDGRTGRYLR